MPSVFYRDVQKQCSFMKNERYYYGKLCPEDVRRRLLMFVNTLTAAVSSGRIIITIIEETSDGAQTSVCFIWNGGNCYIGIYVTLEAFFESGVMYCIVN